MRKTVSLISLLLAALMLSAAFDTSYSDKLFYNLQDYDSDYEYLSEALPQASSDEEKAEILWRLSRAKLTLTDEISKDEKDARLKGYEEAQKYAEKSISASDNYNHLWYASALGRTGQVKGVLSSLSKARPMRTNCEKVQNEFLADDSDTWYVLGGLYNQLSSAGNLRFGDKNFAISYMRRCIDTQDNENRAYLANYLELAKQLYERGWSASKRSKKAGR